ncbi:poly-gamma-glutamate hydrolase family protein [Streptomyces uncialis]|uniref:poly-gamma-glutamate hydrolase family protein n=1 Tax=Streptomyces uncialis TaxID=1048205 RepID=UPI003828BA7D
MEGRNWSRRFRRTPYELLDNASSSSEPIRSTAIIAPHGGSIEQGTSELCLAIAGYTLAGPGATSPAPVPGVLQRDYWMFEGVTDNTSELHVTSTLCDDPAALHICGSNRYAVSVHGFSEKPAKRILIGGFPEDPANPDLNQIDLNKSNKALQLKKNLRAAFLKHYAAEPVEVGYASATSNSHLAGDDKDNIVNRTGAGFGVQLEVSRGLREAMFGNINTAPSRRDTAGIGSGNQAYFWNGFVNAVREAVDDYERGMITS